MKNTVTKTNFRDSFFNAGRKDQFSYDGLGALFDWIEQYEEDCEMEMELDVIALCCDFSEYDSAVKCISDCGYNFDYVLGAIDEDEKEEEALEYLRENTMVIEFKGGIIIQTF